MSDSLDQILQSRQVETLFQPVVSVERRSVIGFEAFARGCRTADGAMIQPKTMFDPSLDPDVALEIDRICRENTLRRFKKIAANHSNVLLFLNVNVSSLKSSKMRPDFLSQQVAELEIDPRRVVIEADVEHLCGDLPFDLAEAYRKQGFLLSLDDSNAAPAALCHLHRLKPDFLKTMRPGTDDAKQERLRGEMLRALAENARWVGCRLVGKGVEEEADAFLLLGAGVYLQQGFFYTKSEQSGEDGDALAVFKKKIHEVHARYRESQTKQIQAKKTAFKDLHRAASKARYRCEGAMRAEFDDLAAGLARDVEPAFTVFILNRAGQEVARTREGGLGPSRDHSIRDYYLHLKTGFEHFVTPVFTSPETKRAHLILASRFYNREGDEYILGIEFAAPEC